MVLEELQLRTSPPVVTYRGQALSHFLGPTSRAGKINGKQSGTRRRTPFILDSHFLGPTPNAGTLLVPDVELIFICSLTGNNERNKTQLFHPIRDHQY